MFVRQFCHFLIILDIIVYTLREIKFAIQNGTVCVIECYFVNQYLIKIQYLGKKYDVTFKIVNISNLNV